MRKEYRLREQKAVGGRKLLAISSHLSGTHATQTAITQKVVCYDLPPRHVHQIERRRLPTLWEVWGASTFPKKAVVPIDASVRDANYLSGAVEAADVFEEQVWFVEGL